MMKGEEEGSIVWFAKFCSIMVQVWKGKVGREVEFMQYIEVTGALYMAEENSGFVCMRLPTSDEMNHNICGINPEAGSGNGEVCYGVE